MTLRNLIVAGAVIAMSATAGFMFYERTQTDPVPSTPLMRPVFSLNDIDGKQRSITEWDGKALVVNFWATWCAPCRREIPVLMALQDELAAQNIQFIGIAIDDPAAVKEYAAQTLFNYPILVGEQEGIDAAEAFGADVVALPMTVVTNHTGHIIDVHTGEITRNEIKAILKRLRQ